MFDFSKFYSEEEVVTLLQKMIAIPSHKDVENREAAMGEFVYDYCTKLGFECEKVYVQGKRFNVNVWLRGEGDGPTLLLNGHMDTVPPYDMIIEPYSGEIRDGYIWGRGGNDMKGALASMITAMNAIKKSGIKLQGDLLFTAVVGEEEESDGTEAFVLNGGQADGAIVGEPSGYEVSIGHRGLEWIQMDVEGITMHGGQAHLGVNAIQMGARLIERIQSDLVPKINSRQNEYMGPAIMNYGKIFGGDQVSTVAGHCTIQFDRRYVPGETVETVMAEYQEIIDKLHEEDPKFKATLSLMPNGQMNKLVHAPLIPEPDSKIVQTVYSVLGEFLGTDDISICRTRGWTDAGVLSTFGKIPTVVFGPGALPNSHTKDERIAIEQIYNFTLIYANIAAQFCGVVK